MLLMQTNVYIDGFNLYYGALRDNPPLKWLDVSAMCRRLLPNDQMNRIRYFTARVGALPHDQQAPARQDVYLRALTTIPNLTIHYGWFARRSTRLPRDPITYSRATNRPEMVSG